MALPTFQDGIPLAARDANALAMELELQHARATQVNFPLEILCAPNLYNQATGAFATVRYVFHLNRYLHYSLLVPTIGSDRYYQILVAGQVGATLTYTTGQTPGLVIGYIDLNALSPVPVAGQPYSVQIGIGSQDIWNNGSGHPIFYLVQESSSTSLASVLPQTIPTIGTTLPAIVLNAISEDTQALKTIRERSAHHGLRIGWLQKGTFTYRILHKNPNLRMKYELYEAGTSITFYYNGVNVHNYSYVSWPDVRDVTISLAALSLTLNTWYTLEIVCTGTDDYAQFDGFTLLNLSEVAD